MGSRDRSKGRQPWVLYGLFALIIFFASSFHMNKGDASTLAEAAIADAVDFYRANPSLDPSPRLAFLTRKSELNEIELSHLETRSDHDYMEMPERLRARTEGRFDALVDSAYELQLEANPGWRYGLTGRGDTQLQYASHVFHHDSNRAYLVTLIFLGLAGFFIERSLGSLFFSVFCALSATVTALAYRTFDLDLGAPWCGPVGIIAGLVGLYFVLGFRSAGIPGWLVFPAWIAAETLLVREAWVGGVESLPVHALGSGVGLGMVIGFLLPLLRNSAAAEKKESAAEQRNSLLGRATELRAANQHMEALKLLEDAAKRAISDRQVVQSYWDLAVELGHARRAGPVLLDYIRAQIRAGSSSQAVGAWIALNECVDGVEVDTSSLVKLGELLLDESHPEEAVAAMRASLTSTPALSSALALRVVNVARDLDSDLTARAAALALADATLQPKVAEDLRALAATAAHATGDAAEAVILPEPEPVRAEPIAPRPASPLADPQADTQTLFGNSADEDLALDEDFEAVSGFSEDDLDPAAISPDALETTLGEISDAELEDTLAAAPTSDPEDISKNDPNAFSLSDLSSEAGANDASSPTLESIDPGAAVSPTGAASLDDDDITDTVSASELHATLAEEAPRERPIVPLSALIEPQVTPPPRVESAAPLASEAAAAAPNEASLADTNVQLTPDLRRMKLVSGIPVALDDQSLSVEMEDGSKSRIPLHRVQALAVGAVAGLSSRPVILVDLVLNWLNPEGGALKVIRFRSDQFNPMSFVSEASTPIAAMRSLLNAIRSGADAEPLPDAAAAQGQPFKSFASLDEYLREVLIARR